MIPSLGTALRHGLLTALLAGVLGVVPAAASPREEALAAEADGRWTEAVGLWERAAREEGTPAARAGFLRVLRTVGDWKRLEREAGAMVEADPAFEEGVLFLAQALAARGRPLEGAERLAAPARESLPAAALRARLLDRMGRHREAAALWGALVDGHDPDRDYRPPERLALGEAAAAVGDFKGAEAMYETATLDSSEYLEARIALALLFQDKHQADVAGNEMVLAAQLFPEHPDMHLAEARLALDGSQLARAEVAARAVLEVRPRDPGALGVLARLSLISDQPAEARRLLQGLLDENPTDRETRALLASTAYLAGDSAAWRDGVRRLAEQDSLYVDGFLDLGRILEFSRRHDEAFAMYREVLRRIPDQPEALIATGLLAMREGNETQARGFLEKGFEGDPFNIRAYNQLELLDTLQKFARYDFPHFEVQLDAASDSALVPLLETRLERSYADLVKLHGWTPRRRTIVEVYPSHDWFSARVTGLPWIGGIPAVCFGDVVAMDSPRTLAGGSNWEQILRHEFGHVVALDMTDKKVPFWFTEGLSVYLEEYPHGMDWDQNLVAAWVDGDLVSVDSLTIAFTRPKKFSQRLLAYHESFLIVRDIVDRHGWEAIPRLLTAFGEGKGLEEAVRLVLKTDMNAFRRRALEVVKGEAAGLPVWPAPDPHRLATLQADGEARRDDPEYLGLLAVTAYQLGDTATAADAAARLAEREPGSARALGIQGLLARAAERPDALELLRRAQAAGSRDLEVPMAAAQLSLDAGDTTAALAAYGRAAEIYPLAEEPLAARARLFRLVGDTAAARREYERQMAQTGMAWSAAMDLARLDLAAGAAEDALRRLDYALSSVPLDADVEGLRGQAYLLLGEDDRAMALFQRARGMDIRSVEAMVGMARYYLKRDDPEEALYFARLALKYNPDHEGAQDLLRRAEGSPQ